MFDFDVVWTRFLNISVSHQSNASFFTPLSYLLWRLSFPSYTFFWRILDFLGFPSVPHLLDNYAKIVNERSVSEPYVRSHITEPPCLFSLHFVFLENNFRMFDLISDPRVERSRGEMTSEANRGAIKSTRNFLDQLYN